MHLCDLAFELQLQMLQLCSRQDLASLSRAHTSLQDVADYALYSHIYCSSFIAFQSILETLTTNKKKASLVKVLDVEFIYVGVDNLRLQSLEIMAGMLSNMLNLHKLRISVAEEFRRSGGDSESGGINQVISGSYFRLRILCLEESQCDWEDIKGIVASQPDLRLLGFHRRNKISKSLVTITRKLHHDPSCLHPIPMIFMLDFYDTEYYATLEFLPSYHRPGEALEVFREFETLFNSSYSYTLQLNLLGISEENINLFREVMEAVATCRPKDFDHLHIIVHQTSIQNLWQFPEFVKSLTLFQCLEMLSFNFPYVWRATGLDTRSTDMRLHLVNSDLERLCPKLQNITFRCKRNRGSRTLIHRRPHWLPVTG